MGIWDNSAIFGIFHNSGIFGNNRIFGNAVNPGIAEDIVEIEDSKNAEVSGNAGISKDIAGDTVKIENAGMAEDIVKIVISVIISNSQFLDMYEKFYNPANNMVI